MTFAELKQADRVEVSYMYLLCNLSLYKQRLEKITLYRKKNDKGRLVSSVTCYLLDNSNNIHTLYFRLYDEDYLWFCSAVAEDFPKTTLEDLTAEEDKLVKKGGGQNDIQPSVET